MIFFRSHGYRYLNVWYRYLKNKNLRYRYRYLKKSGFRYRYQNWWDRYRYLDTWIDTLRNECNLWANCARIRSLWQNIDEKWRVSCVFILYQGLLRSWKSIDTLTPKLSIPIPIPIPESSIPIPIPEKLKSSIPIPVLHSPRAHSSNLAYPNISWLNWA